MFLKNNVYGSWEINRGLDCVKTRCLVIIIHFKNPLLTGKLQYRRKFKRYLGRDGGVFVRYLGQDGKVVMRYLGQDRSVFMWYLGGNRTVLRRFLGRL